MLSQTGCFYRVEIDGPSSSLESPSFQEKIPTIQMVSAANTNGVYSAGASLLIQVKTSKPIFVDTSKGSPLLALNFLPQIKYASFIGGSGTDVLSFGTEIADGEGVDVLNYSGIDALVPNGAILTDAEGNPLKIELPLLSGGADLGSQRLISIDTTAPVAQVTEGLPSLSTSASELDLEISDFDVYEYRYKIGAATGTDCSDPTGYSDWRRQSLDGTPQRLKTQIGGLGEGEIKLCLLGRDLAGNAQGPNQATTYQWNRALTPPSSLTYSNSSALYVVGQPIVANLPSLNGTRPFKFSISPALPKGLTLDPNTGAISGTPIEIAASTTYSVTAANSLESSTTANLNLEVRPVGSFTLATVNENETLSSFKVFSGTCLNGKTVTVTLPQDTKIAGGGTNYQTCSNSIYTFGISLSGEPGLRVFKLQQGDEIISRQVAYSPSAVESAQTGPNGSITAAVLDPINKKIFIAGYFSTYNGISRKGLARLNSDGSLDTSFDVQSSIQGVLTVLYYDSSHQKIYAGGTYGTMINGQTNFGRFNSDGSIDSSFNGGTGFDGDITGIAVDTSNEKIYVCGGFWNYDGSQQNYLARLNSDGSLDSSFNIGAGFNDVINALFFDQSRQKLYVGGWFNSYDGVSRNYLARLNSDGSLDTSFAAASTGFDGIVATLLFDPTSQKLYVGGSFNAYDGVGRNYLARLNSDGSLDTSFAAASTGFNGTVSALLLEPTSQKLYVGGWFNAYDGVNRKYLARLNSDGSLDTNFATASTGFNNVISALLLEPTSQKLYVGGSFDTYNGLPQKYLVRLTSNGSFDANFMQKSIGFNGSIYTQFYDPADQKLYVAGAFTAYNGITQNYLARLNTDGSIDNSFEIGFGFNGAVNAIYFDSTEQKLYVAGYFTSYDRRSQNHIVRLNKNGSIDPTFNSGSGISGSGVIKSIIYDNTQQKIIISGNFRIYSNTLRTGVARLNHDGSLDTTFTPVVSNWTVNINTMALDTANQKIYIGGEFGVSPSILYTKIRRLNNDGTTDSAFATAGGNFNGALNALLFENSSQKIYVGGSFTSYDGTTRNRIARLNSDGSIDTAFIITKDLEAVDCLEYDSINQKLYVGSSSLNGSITKGTLWRVNSDGALDHQLNNGAGFNDIIKSIKLNNTAQKIYVGGTFRIYNGINTPYLSFLTTDGSVTIPGLNVQAQRIALNRNDQTSITATGGIPPYTFAVILGGGEIDSTTGLFTAPNSSSQPTIEVRDSSTPNLKGYLTLKVFSKPLSVTPATSYLLAQQSLTLGVSGGVPPYRFYFKTGLGSISGEGVFTAPSQKSTTALEIADAMNSVVQTEIQTVEPLQLMPGELNIVGGMSTTFTAKGGHVPYFYSLISGSGAIASTTGFYTAPLTTGNATVAVRDTMGNMTLAKVLIKGLNQPLSIEPPTLQLPTNKKFTFSARGGSGPYAFSIKSGLGTITAKGVFQAPNTPGTTTVELNDGTSTVQGIITTTPPLDLAPTAAITAIGKPIHFTTTGGIPPYSYEVSAGPGMIDAEGLFNSNDPGVSTIKVSDSLGSFRYASVTIGEPLQLTANTNRINRQGTLLLKPINGVPPFFYSILSGGGSINTSAAPGTFAYYFPGASLGPVHLQIRDSLDQASDMIISVTETQPQIIYPASTITSFIDAPIVAINPVVLIGDTPSNYSIANNCLPEGLSLNRSTGEISGTPTGTAKNLVCTVIASNSGGSSTTDIKIILYTAADFTLESPVDNATVASYQVYAGKCATEFVISVASLEEFAIANSTEKTVACKAGRFSVGILFSEPFNTPRTLSFNQANRTISKTVIPNPSGFSALQDGADDYILASALDPSTNKIYVGGNFTSIGSQRRDYFARLNDNGSLDTTFTQSGSGFNKLVRAIAFDSAHQKVYVGGDFTTYNGISRNYIARFNSDGSLDTTFASVGSGLSGRVYSIYYDSTHQRIYVGGSFTSYNGTSRYFIARLNNDGSLDNSFALTGTNISGSYVRSIAVDESSDKIYAIGSFALSINSVMYGNVLRLNNDGTVDTSYGASVAPNFDVVPEAGAFDSSLNKLYVAGPFNKFRSTVRSGIARLNNDGTLDTTFAQTGSGIGGITNWVHTIAVDTVAQKIYVGGQFTNYNSSARGKFLRLNSDGSLDTTFATGAGCNSFVHTLQFDSAHQRIYVGGRFGSIDGIHRNRIARVNTDNTIDSNFGSRISGFNGALVRALLFDSDIQKIYAGGEVDSFNNGPSQALHRLNLDGTEDSGFSLSGTGFDRIVLSLAKDTIQNKLFVGGGFTTYNGATQNGLARLNSNGSLDTTFAVGSGFSLGGSAATIGALFYDSSSDKLYVGGNFTTYQGFSKKYLVRLNSDGSIDTSFTLAGTGFNGQVYSLFYDGATEKLYVGGLFTSYDVTSQSYIARLNKDGSLDTTFAPTWSVSPYAVQSIAYDDVAKQIYIGGGFSWVSPPTGNMLHRLNNNGSVDTSFSSSFNGIIYSLFYDKTRKMLYVGGDYTAYSGASQKNLARLNFDGSIDTSFMIAAGFNSSVMALAYDSTHETLYAGGGFNTYNYILQGNFVKLLLDGSLAP